MFGKLFALILIFIAFDSVYLTLISDMAGKMVKNIQQSPLKIRPLSFIIVYILLAFGMLHFIIKKKASVAEAFSLGIIIYGVYDFTNYTLLNDYLLQFAVIDTLWGGTLFALTYTVYKKLFSL